MKTTDTIFIYPFFSPAAKNMPLRVAKAVVFFYHNVGILENKPEVDPPRRSEGLHLEQLIYRSLVSASPRLFMGRSIPDAGSRVGGVLSA